MPEKRILIVNDEPDLLETIQVTLEMEGYECLVAYDGFRGLDRARSEKPSLILLDLGLPDVDDRLPATEYTFRVRKGFQQYVNYRPIKLIPGVPAPLRASRRRPGR